MIRFLVNPAAGGGRARRHLGEIRKVAASVGADVQVSCSGPDVTAQSRRAVEDGVDRLIVAGGDGTVHLAVQALAGTDSALGVLPMGRGNDYAASLNMRRPLPEALAAVVDGSVRRVDLGKAGDELFAFYAGVGFDSATSKMAEGHPRWWPDSITYAVAVVRTLFNFVPPKARIEFDDGHFEGRVMFATACNGPRFGGGMQIAPMAELDDGILDLVIVRATSKLELLRIFPRVYRGAHVDHPAVSFHRTRAASFRFDPESLLGSDGELVGEVGDHALAVEVVPGALCVVSAD